jgi:hypothetical protein
MEQSPSFLSLTGPTLTLTKKKKTDPLAQYDPTLATRKLESTDFDMDDPA